MATREHLSDVFVSGQLWVSGNANAIEVRGGSLHYAGQDTDDRYMKVQTSVELKTANYEMTTADRYILASGAICIDLPSPTTKQVYTIKSIAPDSAVVSGVSATIDGETTQTLSQWEALKVVSDGTNWSIV